MSRANQKLLILACLWKIRADFHRNLYFGLLTDAILSIFGSYEAMRYDSKSHPTDCYSKARLEDDFIDQIEVVIDLLSSTNVFVLSTFGSTPDLGRSVEEMPIATWDSLAEEANLKAAAKSAAGAALAALTLNAANQKLSRRQLHINEESAANGK